MATQLQLRRGTTAENDVFTGAVGELTMDTDTNGLRIHDGNTTGGFDVPTAATADYVVEWQAPTDLNNYTWYRKYKSGWVEQGGRCTVPATNSYNSSSVSTTLPVSILNSAAGVLLYSGLGAAENFANCENQATLTTTTVTIGRWNNGTSTAAARPYSWTVYGMSAS